VPDVRRVFRIPFVRTPKRKLMREVSDELEFHLDTRVERLVALGWKPDAARREALRQFGDIESVRDNCVALDIERERSARWTDVVADLLRDIRYAVHALRKTPGWTTVAILTLALGIGANTAIFSVVHRLLLAPLSYPDGNRIVMLTVGQGDALDLPTVAVLRVIRDRARSIETVAAVSVDALAVQEDDGQDTVHAYITPNYLRMLRVVPALGRSFTPAEERGEGAPVAMISYSRWQHEFNGRANAIGSSVEIIFDRREDPERRRYTIIGVTPRSMALPMSLSSFNHNLHEARPGVWLPLDLPGWSPTARPNSYARLRPGVSKERARKELQNIIDSSPELGAKRPIIGLMRAQDMLDPSETHMVEVLFAAVGVLLLISCANVANLLMSRVWTRRREFAVRAALGAGRTRLARQVLTESTLLALPGGLLGIALAWQTLRIIIALRPPALANLDTVRIESSVLLWTAAISVLTGVLFGALPALFAARDSVGDVLRSETRGGFGSIATRRVRSALIVFEIALSIVLLVSAGLLVRSFAAMQSAPLGFEPRGMVSFDMLFNPATTPRNLRAVLRNQIVEQLRAVPGVTDVAIGMIPATGYGALMSLSTDPDPGGAERSVPEFSTIFVGPTYFRVAGIRLIEGRSPDSLTAPAQLGPSTAAPMEVVVNRGLATRFWPNGGALGARLHENNGQDFRQEYTVVGIAEDVHVPGERQVARSAVLYRPPMPFGVSVIVRTATPSADLLPTLRKAITSIQPTPYIQTTTIGEDFIRDALAPTRFAMALMAAFAAIALALAVIGLYGVISYGVTQRTREIGVRMALGAEPTAVAWLVLGNGLRLAITGVAIGAAGALAATRVLSGMLFAVSVLDPTTFVATALVVAAVALLASYLPARRALRMDPADVLRAD
jgi:putative ABC transport system permease protein